jgi:tRNA(Arg) A34 adenosine deaminase TadA
MKTITETDIEFIRQTATGKGNCAVGAAMLLHNNERYATPNKMLEDDDPTAHAAIVITRSKRGMIRKNQSFELLLSEKPCPMCVSAIYHANLNNLYYLDDNKINHITLNSSIDFWYEEIHTHKEK